MVLLGKKKFSSMKDWSPYVVDERAWSFLVLHIKSNCTSNQESKSNQIKQKEGRPVVFGKDVETERMMGVTEQ